LKITKHWFTTYLTKNYSKNKKFGLDIGCRFKPYDNEFQCKYIGIDLPSEKFKDSKKHPDILSSATNLPFQKNSFDFISCYSVIPYIKNIDNLFSDMFNILKPNGIAVIIIMNLRGLNLQPKTHFENRYSSKKLHDKLRQHNFISIKSKNIKSSLFSLYYDLTSVYAYAIVTPKK
jgi:ubiquinone/menaquinone biosynthesis C-methylase UbiE